MQKETIANLTAGTLYEYSLLIAEFFPGIATVDEFIDAYNKILPAYQVVKSKKMDPYFIRQERATSCTSASILMGLWWYLNQGDTPVYHLKTQQEAGLYKSERDYHCKLELHDQGETKYTHLRTKKDASGSVERYSMQPANKPDSTYSSTTNVATFTANRISTFGIQKSQRSLIVAPATEEKKQIMQLVGKHDEYFTFLRHCFANWRTAIR
jgi:hypothetical protein